MKLRPWFFVVLNMVLAALVVSGAAFYAAKERAKNTTLEIRDAVSRKVYRRWRFPAQAEKEFSIEFVHSVHQSPVRETFYIEEKMIRPAAVTFFSFGAGMQSDPEDGLVFSRNGDAVHITGFKNSHKELNYIVGTVSDHLLYIAGEKISLRELCGKNAHITIRCY